MLPRIGRRPAGLLALTAAGVITAAAPAAAGTTTGTTAGLTTGLTAGTATGLTTGTAPRWSPDLTAIGGDDVNVRHDGRALRLGSLRTGPAALHDAQATGQLLLAPKDLREPADRVQARVNGGGSVAVDVRAWRGGSWTEWHPSGSALPSASTRIQVRIVLAQKAGAPAPAVSGVELTAGRVRAPRASAAAAAAYRVFATREGLVGGTTANGHVITERDHFVALPSRRGLSPKGTGDYSVRACTEDGSRCEYAPVWDVGPWNTRDDYWNPSSVREMWKDLPQGTPESQAAYQDGYNGGQDEFGRTVLNPAGIDLADGTFWDGLGLTDNAWVNVTYLWTGTGAKGVVGTSGTPVTLRASASTSATAKGLAADHANVVVECHVRGENVTGTYGTSDLWNRIGPGHFIPDVYLDTGSDDPVAPAC